MANVTGLLLAGGSGSRMGKPKALIRHGDETPWLATARRALLDGGCADVLTVLGARADDARALIPDAWTVSAANWHEGMSASLAAGLRELRPSSYHAAMIHLVDLPDVGASVVARLLPYGTPSALARATYGGDPGHPVVIGRDHWEHLLGTLGGDAGARDYLAARDVTLVECADLAAGYDVDSADNHPGGPMLET